MVWLELPSFNIAGWQFNRLLSRLQLETNPFQIIAACQVSNFQQCREILWHPNICWMAYLRAYCFKNDILWPLSLPLSHNKEIAINQSSTDLTSIPMYALDAFVHLHRDVRARTDLVVVMAVVVTVMIHIWRFHTTTTTTTQPSHTNISPPTWPPTPHRQTPALCTMSHIAVFFFINFSLFSYRQNVFQTIVCWYHEVVFRRSASAQHRAHIYIYIYIYNHQSCISATVRKSIWLVRQFDDISYITKYVQVTWLSITIIGSNYCLNSHLYRNMPHSSQNLLA